MTNLPHFDYPFRFNGHKAAVVEQDSDDDIVACVQAAVRVEAGTRQYVSQFGISDPTFREMPLNLSVITAEIRRSEPRANPALDQQIAALISTINVGVGHGQ